MDERRRRRKWTLRAHGRQVVFVKKPVESTERCYEGAHLGPLPPVLSHLIVEIPIGDKYKPDVVYVLIGGIGQNWQCGREVM